MSPARLEVAILVGLQGAGKTTFFHEQLASSHVLVSKDNFRHNKNRRARQTQLIEEALSIGRSVCVDNTNVTRADRKEIVEHAHRHGAKAVCFYLKAPFDECYKRNEGRTGKKRVPDVAIKGTAKRFEEPKPDEFDEMYLVTNMNVFDVVPMGNY